MAINPLTAALPASPPLDDAGNLTPAWRAFLQALVSRTGGNVGASTSATAAEISAETANRIAGDAALGVSITSLSSALSIETAARIAADSDLAGRDVAITDQTTKWLDFSYVTGTLTARYLPTAASDLTQLRTTGQLFVNGDLDTWIFSSDATGSAGSSSAGIGSGNADAGTTAALWLYSGNSNTGASTGPMHAQTGDIGSGTGTSGSIDFTSGQSPGGTSGDVTFKTGAAATRGQITLDAPLIHNPGAFVIQSPGTFNAGTDDTTGSVASATSALYSGNAANAQSGDVFFYTGDSSGGGTGKVWLNSGAAGSGNSGDIQLSTGSASGARGNIILDGSLITTLAGSILHLTSLGTTGGSGASGDAGIESGDTTAGTGNSGAAFLGSSDAGGKAGAVTIYGGESHGSNQAGGSVEISTGSAHTGNANGGDVTVALGTGIGTGRQGLIILSGMPTANPGVSGALWVDTTTTPHTMRVSP